MAMDELRLALEKNPNDTRTFQTVLEPILREGDQGQVDLFLDTVLSAVGNEEALINLMRAADLKAKTVGGAIHEYVSYRVGKVFLDYIGNEDMAEMYFRRLSADSPLAEGLGDFYVQFYLKKQNWRKLEQMFQDEATRAGEADPETASRRKAARLARDNDNPQRALTYWQAVKKQYPEDEEATDELLTLFRQTDKWHQVAEILKARADALPNSEVDRKVALYEELVPIYRDKMNMEPKVSACYQSILEVQPDNRNAFNALCRHFESSNRIPELVKLLRARVEAERDPDEQFDLLSRIAAIMEGQFSNTMEAIRAYESMRELRPDDLDVLLKLKGLYEQRRDWPKFIELGRHELTFLGGPERLEKLRKLARLSLENVREVEAGIGLWNEVRQTEPGDAEAFEALQMLYERGKDFDGLGRLLEERLELEGKPDEKVLLLERLALLYGTRVKDNDLASNAWLRLLELNPENHRAKAELKKLLVKAKDLDGLDVFFRTYSTLGDYARTLELLVKEEEESVLRVQLWFRIASVYQEEAGGEERARKALEQVLEEDPTNVQAAEFLVDLYSTLGRFQELVRVQELLLEHKEDLSSDERLFLLTSKAQVHEEKLRQLDEAFFTLIHAYELDWTRRDVYDDLERLAALSDNWGTFISVLEGAIHKMEEPGDRVPYLLRIGEIWGTQLKDADNAVSSFLATLELDSTNRSALAALEGLYETALNWQAYRDIVKKRLDVEGEPSERRRLLRSWGDVCLDRLAETEEASEAFRQLTREFPVLEEGYDRLTQVLLLEERHEELIEILETRKAALHPRGEELAHLLVDIGMLHYGARGHVGEAVEYYVQALQVEPAFPRAVELLEQFVGDQGVQWTVAAALADVYGLTGQDALRADALEIQAMHRAGSEQAELLRQLRSIYQGLKRPLDLSRTLRRLLRHDPRDLELKTSSEELAAQTGEWHPLVQLYLELAEALLEEESYRHEFLRSAADIYSRHLDDRSRAKELYRTVLEEHATDLVALAALEEIAIHEEDWQGLLGIYETRLGFEADPGQRIGVLFCVANLAREHLSDPLKASLAVEQILGEEPGNLDALQLLDQLYTEQERWSDLLNVLEQTIALVTDVPVQIQLLSRVAELFEFKLNNPSQMVDRLEQVLVLDSANAGAIEVLDRNIRGEIALPVLDLLETCHRSGDNWRRVAELLELRKEFVQDDITRLAIQKDIVGIHENRLGDTAMAFVTCRLALSMDPEDDSTLETLLRLSSSLGNAEELFSVLESQSSEMSGGPQQTKMWRILADLALTVLDDGDVAIGFLNQVVEADPQDLPSVLSLERLYEERQRFADLARTYDAHVSLINDLEEKKRLLLEAGQLFQGVLEQPDEAISRYEQLLALDPRDVAGLASLQNLYEETRRFDELEQVLARMAGQTDDPVERRGLSLRRAEVLELDLERLEDANMVLSGLFASDPLDIEVVERLEVLHGKREDWLSLLDTLRHKLDMALSEERIPVMMKMAELYAGPLEDLHSANGTYRQLLGEFPGHAGALDQLERIVVDGQDKEEAYLLLRPVLERQEEWERLSGVMAHYRDSLEDPHDRIRVLLEMVSIADGKLGRTEVAFQLAAQALALDPRRLDIADILENLAGQGQLALDLVTIYTDVAQAAEVDEDGVALRLRKARWLKVSLANLDAAIVEYEGLREDTDASEVLEALDELYSVCDRFAELAGVLRARVERASGTEDRISLLFRLASLLETSVEQPAQAMEVLKEAHLLDTGNLDVLSEMRRLYDASVPDAEAADFLETWYSMNEEWVEAAHVVRRRFELAEDKATKLELALKLVGIFLDRLDNRPNAMVSLGEALELDPEDMGNLDLFLRLAEETGLKQDAVNYLQLARVEAEDPEAYLRLSMETGRMCRGLGMLEDAEFAWRNVIAKDDMAAPAYRSLVDLFGEQERFRDQEEMLSLLVELEEYDQEKVALLLKLGALQRDQLNEPERAIGSFKAALAADDQNREALEALAFLYEMAEEHESLSSILRGLVDLTHEPEERTNLLSRLAILEEEQLGRQDKAVSCWQEMLDWSPNDATIMAQMQRLFVALEDWPSFVDMAEREVRLASSVEERKVELWRQLARVTLDHMEDPMTAQQHWESVRHVRGNDEEALMSLRSIYRTNEDFPRLATLLSGMAGDSDRAAEQRLDFLRELGHLKMEEVMDPEGAIAAWLAVLDLRPDDLDAFVALEQLYQDTMKLQECVDLLLNKRRLLADVDEQVALLDRVASLQEESLNQWEAATQTRREILAVRADDLDQYERIAAIYEMHGSWLELCQILEDRLPHEGSETIRYEVLVRLSQLYEERIEDDSLAMSAVVRAAAGAPGDPEILAAAERIGRRSSLWSELRTVWSGAVVVTEDEETKLELLLKLGDLLATSMHQPTEAVEWYEKALALNPEEESALKALVELYGQAEDWSSMACRLDALARVSPDFTAQVAFFLRLGDLFRDQLGDIEKAQEAYGNALELDPNELRAVDALHVLYTQSEKWEKLIEVLAIRAAIEPGRDSELKLESGAVLEDKLNDPVRAAELYEDLLTFDPNNRDAFHRLENIYKNLEQWDKLAETYEKLLSVTGAEEDRAVLLRSLALISESMLDNREAAADYYQQLLDLSPDNHEAMEALETLYADQERWDDLVLVLRRMVDVQETIASRVDYLCKIASIQVEKQEDLGSATMVYREVLELDPGHVETIEKLEVLYGEQGDWMEVQDILDKRLSLVGSDADRLALYLKKGDIYRDELLMPHKAREEYYRAIQECSGADDAVDRLYQVYADEENWEQVVHVLMEQARSSSSEDKKARVMARMGVVMLEKQDRAEEAVQVLEAALERVPNLPEAVAPLADIYLAAEAWAKAYPLLMILMDQTTGEAAAASGLYRKMALVAMNTGQRDVAMRYYQRAFESRPDDLDVLEGLARLSIEAEEYDQAQRYLDTLLQKGQDVFDLDKQIEIYRLLGDVAMKLNHSDAARGYFDQVLALQPDDTQVLAELAVLMETHSDWEAAITYRRNICELLPDGPEKWRTLIAIGDTYRQKLSDQPRAIEAYREALDVQPNSRPALVKLLEIYINAQAFREALTVLEHLIAAEPNPEMRANYTFSMATICRDELGEPDRAVEYYEQTLDLAPSRLEAFQAVDEILTQNKNWDGLENAYRQMATRVRSKGDNEKLEFTLYRNLGEIYRTRLNMLDMATHSYELASRLRPGDMDIREILTQLYEKLGNPEKCLVELRAIMAHEPERIETYRRLSAVLRELERDDDAWFALSVLAITKKLTPQEQVFLDRKRLSSLPSSSSSVTAAQWVRDLFARVEDPNLGQVFQTLYQSIGGNLSGLDLKKDLGLKNKDELDMNQKTVFTTVAVQVSRLLGIPLPKIFVSERAFGISIQSTMPPVLVIGRDMLSGKSEKELAFVLAKYLTYFHPMHLLAGCYPPEVLKLLWQVAVKYTDSSAAVEKENDEQFQNLSKVLAKQMSPQLANVLTGAVGRLLAKSGVKISQWLTGVELTANHAGLLACMDLEVAADILRQQSAAFSTKLPPKEKAKDLFLYANSEEFARLRGELGIELKKFVSRRDDS
jgi:tetratricopeptide (TPR) repeat protein